MITKRILSGLAGLLAFVMLLGIFLQLFLPDGKRVTDWFTKHEVEQTETVPGNNEIEPTAEAETHVMAVRSIALMSAGPSEIATFAAEQGVSKTITATVQPSDAVNKKVDWSIAWADPSVTDNIANYLTVTPSTDGSLTATVFCKKSFRGKSAVITVTARDGGVEAHCAVTFKGEPATLTVNGGSAATCSLGTQSDFNVVLSNVFNDVDSSYIEQLKVDSITYSGTCKVADKTMTFSTGNTTYSNIKTVNLSEFHSYYDGNVELVTATLTDGNLHLSLASTGNMCKHFSYTSTTMTSSQAYYSDLNGYADIVVSCGALKATFRVNFRLGVNNLSIAPSSIQF